MATSTRSLQQPFRTLCCFQVSLLLLLSVEVQGQNPGGGLPWMPVSGSRQQLPSTTRPADMAPAAGLASNGLGSRSPGAAIAAGARRRPRQPPGGRAAGGQQPPVRGTVKAASATANPAGSLHNVLAKNAPLFRSLFTVLDISADQVPASAVGTFFAPSDDAITEFLQDMGLTAQQLAARPELVDLIVSYHFAPGYQVQGLDDVADGSRVLLTGDEQYILRMSRGTGNKVVLSDVQKGKATVLDGPITPDNSDGISVYIIDRVLKSANYFSTIEAALQHSPYWISAKNAAVKAKVLPLLEGSAITLLVPDNSAFKPLEANLTRASPARLADILKYHTLPKVRRIPRGFEPGTVDTLLKGHVVEVDVTEVSQKDPFSGKQVQVPAVTIQPEVGRPANVTYFNIFAGKAILHGINHLLLPELPPDENEAPPPDDEQPPEDEQPATGVAEESGPVATRPVRGSSQQGRDPTMPAGAVGRRRRGDAPSQGPNKAQKPTAEADTAPTDDDSGADGPAAGAAASRSRAGPNVGPAAALPRGPSSVNGATMPSKRPSAPARVAAVSDTEAEEQPGRRLLSLPRSMLAAGLQSARQLMGIQQLTGTTQGPRPRSNPGEVVSGALSSTVNVGAMGELQSFANGISMDKTLTALMLAAVPKVPKQYVNRYGALKGPQVQGGCLNCKAWGKQPQ